VSSNPQSSNGFNQNLVIQANSSNANASSKPHLLMQHLTSASSSSSSSSSSATVSVSSVASTSTINNRVINQAAPPGSLPRSISYGQDTPNPQILARRSSFSGLSSPVPVPTPNAGAAAAAAAAAVQAASVSSGVIQPGNARTQNLPQRHASGGSFPSNPRPQLHVQQNQQQLRRLSESLEHLPHPGGAGRNVEDKQRSLLQQLLSE
jgi:hypothetical protein